MRKPSVPIPAALVVLIAAQIACATVFFADAVRDVIEHGIWSVLGSAHLLVECLAVLVLIAAVVLEIKILRDTLRREARLRRQLSVAATAINEVIDDFFDKWGFTPAERDIALFMVKGFSIAEIAQLRGSAEGTIKSHTNAIYRKAGVTGRGEMLSLLIEDLVELNDPVQMPEARSA